MSAKRKGVLHGPSGHRKRQTAPALPPARDEQREYSSPACFLHELAFEHTPKEDRAVRIKRIYETPSPADGFRVLVDRLWPRGIKKEKAALDAWTRELAPSTSLRQWFGHDPKRFAEFGKRYRAELRESAEAIEALRLRAQQQPVTLLYAAKDPHVNHAVILCAVISGEKIK